MRMHWSVGTGHSLGPWRRDMQSHLERGAVRATDRVSLEARDGMRSAMRAQRLGGLANAVKQTSDYRKRRVHRTADGFSASGVVYIGAANERTTGALKAYLDGPVSIAPKGGRKWLAIATPSIPKRVGRYKMTPARYVAAGLEEKIGPLRFVPGKRAGVAYLIADNVSIRPDRAGSARRLPKSGRVRAGRAQVGIVAFVLIRQTRRDARLSVDEVMEKYRQKLIPYFARELTGGFAKPQKGGMGYSFSQRL